MDFPVVAWLTLAVLVVQATIYGFQLCQMKRSTDAAKESADAAIRAVAFTERTHPITERAFVLVESVITTNHAGGALGIGLLSGNSIVVFVLKNFGRTVAHSVQLNGALTGVGNFSVDELPPLIIAPQGTNSWRTKPLRDWIDDELIKGVNAGLPILRYRLDVTYMDAFKKSHRYHSEGEYVPAIQRFLITDNREIEISE